MCVAALAETTRERERENLGECRRERECDALASDNLGYGIGASSFGDLLPQATIQRGLILLKSNELRVQSYRYLKGKRTHVVLTRWHLCHVRRIRWLPNQLALARMWLQHQLRMLAECVVGVVGIAAAAAAAAASSYLRVATLDKVYSIRGTKRWQSVVATLKLELEWCTARK